MNKISILIILYFLPVLLTYSKEPFAFWQRFEPPYKHQVVAHRGVCEAAPENTLPVFELAYRCGMDWVEADVRLTNDGHHIILYDEMLDRTTNGSGLVNEHTLAEIKELDAGIWFAERYAGA
jgi:glycerophosphoryl diester phosphodiesterase